VAVDGHSLIDTHFLTYTCLRSLRFICYFLLLSLAKRTKNSNHCHLLTNHPQNTHMRGDFPYVKERERASESKKAEETAAGGGIKREKKGVVVV
jgi:hypothetical protein